MFKVPISMGFLIASVTAVFLSACVGGPDPNSFGGRLQLAGGELSAIGEQWNEGEAMVRKGGEMIDGGREDVADGDDLSANGRHKISSGEDMVARGRRLKEEAEEAYRLRQSAAGRPTAIR